MSRFVRTGTVLDWLILGFLPGLLTSAILWAGRRLGARTASRRRWTLAAPERMRICIAASPDVETGEYRRPSTGIGQAVALALIAPSIARGWRDVDIQSVYFPHELPGQDLESDLILLGGPKTNDQTRSALHELSARLGATQEGSVIVAGGQRFEGSSDSNSIESDYGLVIRTSNPFSPKHRIIILSGSHTYGTVAAARFLVESPEARRSGDLVVVVRSRIRSGHALTPEVVWDASMSDAKGA